MEYLYQYQETLFRKEKLEEEVSALGGNSDLLIIRRKYQRGKALFSELQKKIDALAMEQNRKDLQLAETQDQIQNVQNLIYGGSIGSPRELETLQGKDFELQRKAENIVKEQEKLTRSITKEQEKIEEYTEKLDNLQNLFAASQKKLKKDHTDLTKQLNQCEKELKTLTKKIKKKDMAEFMEKRTNHSGKLYAKVANGDTCNCCYRIITTPTLNRLKNGVTVCCDNCNRILIYTEEPPCEIEEKQV
ncbi:MAG: hypothetical protein RR233_07160 [Clostridiales bacterium]